MTADMPDDVCTCEECIKFGWHGTAKNPPPKAISNFPSLAVIQAVRDALKEATEWNWLDEENPPPCEAFNKIDNALALLDTLPQPAGEDVRVQEAEAVILRQVDILMGFAKSSTKIQDVNGDDCEDVIKGWVRAAIGRIKAAQRPAPAPVTDDVPLTKEQQEILRVAHRNGVKIINPEPVADEKRRSEVQRHLEILHKIITERTRVEDEVQALMSLEIIARAALPTLTPDGPTREDGQPIGQTEGCTSADGFSASGTIHNLLSTPAPVGDVFDPKKYNRRECFADSEDGLHASICYNDMLESATRPVTPEASLEVVLRKQIAEIVPIVEVLVRHHATEPGALHWTREAGKEWLKSAKIISGDGGGENGNK